MLHEGSAHALSMVGQVKSAIRVLRKMALIVARGLLSLLDRGEQSLPQPGH